MKVPIPKNDTEIIILLRFQVEKMREIIQSLEKAVFRPTPKLPSIVYEEF